MGCKHWSKSKTLWGLLILTLGAISKNPMPHTKSDWLHLLWIGVGFAFTAYGRLYATQFLVSGKVQDKFDLN